jgi:hypothetical protein
MSYTLVSPSLHTPPIEEFEIVERVPGTATTDFGTPGVLVTSDLEPLAEEDIERHIGLLMACWSTFDNILHRIVADFHFYYRLPGVLTRKGEAQWDGIMKSRNKSPADRSLPLW